MTRKNKCNYCALVEIKERFRNVVVKRDASWGRVTVLANGKEVASFEELTDSCVCGGR